MAVTNCCIKRNREDEFEILAHNKSSITNLPKKFKVNDEGTNKIAKVNICDLGTIEELKDLKEWQHVNVVGKVEYLSPSEEIKGKSPGCVYHMPRKVRVISDL